MADLTYRDLALRHEHLVTEVRKEIDITERLLNRPDNLLHHSEDRKADFFLLEMGTELGISRSLDLLKRSRQISAAVFGRNH